MGKKLTQEEFEARVSIHYNGKVKVLGKYLNKRSPIILECECGNIFQCLSQSAMDTTYIAQGCLACTSNKIEREIVYCKWCGKPLERTNYQIERSETGFFYCSRDCGNLHKNQLREESGEWKESQNYRRKAFETYEHKCSACGWNEDERILEVHHIDSNRTHNEVENLCILCPICHRKITLGYYQLQGDILIPL